MEQSDALYLFAEIGAVLVGFVGLTAAYQSTYKGIFSAAVKIGQRYILMTGALLLFASLLPIVLNALGLDGRLLWRLSAGGYGLLSLITRLDAGRIIGAMPEEVWQRNFKISMLITGGTTTAHVLLALAVIFGPAHLPFGGLYVAMLYFGLVTTISIFAANTMPRTAGLRRQIEAAKADEDD